MKKPKSKAKRGVDHLDGIPVYCRYDEAVDIDKITGHPRNPNKHGDDQIALLAKIIKSSGWRNPICVSNRSGFVIKGHGRLMAARVLGVDQVPVEYQDYESEAAEYNDLIADNRIAELAERDMSIIKDLLEELDTGANDMDMTGYTEAEIERLMTQYHVEPESEYTNKIIAPVYEPKGERPPLSDLMDRSKTEQLIAGINAAAIPEDIKMFMRFAAERHTVFNFRQIAEYYCHADPVLQDLMERSGMVIIDFKKAIEYGFVHLTKRLGELADLEEAENADA
jgi:ParB-like chromosome segregation protein Spo0J